MNLVLIGYRGTGKSSVATLLGQQLGWPVVSLDDEIERQAGQRIVDIVAQRGWDGFRDLEQALCRSYAQRQGQILDYLRSLFFTAPVVYHYIRYFLT